MSIKRCLALRARNFLKTAAYSPCIPPHPCRPEILKSGAFLIQSEHTSEFFGNTWLLISHQCSLVILGLQAILFGFFIFLIHYSKASWVWCISCIFAGSYLVKKGLVSKKEECQDKIRTRDPLRTNDTHNQADESYLGCPRDPSIQIWFRLVHWVERTNTRTDWQTDGHGRSIILFFYFAYM